MASTTVNRSDLDDNTYTVYVDEKLLSSSTFEDDALHGGGTLLYDSIDGWLPVAGTTYIEVGSYVLTDGIPYTSWPADSDGDYEGRFIELKDVNGHESQQNIYQDTRGITQTIETQADLEHTISFDYLGHYGHDESVNTFEILVDGVSVGSFSDNDTQASTYYLDNKWHYGEVSFVADADGYSEITFIENSNNDYYKGAGMYVDNIEIVQDAYSSEYPIYVEGDYYADSVENVDDSLIGNSIGNTIFAYKGADNVAGEDGDDILYGNHGDDTLTGGYGQDMLYGGQDDDDLLGNQGDDLIYGHKGDDWIYGGQDDDLLYGNQGSDYLFGNVGNDSIWAGQDDDWIDGGDGDDLLWGNKGADLFHLSAGFDIIYDFSAADGDRLEVSSTSTLGYQQIGSDLLVSHNDGTALLLNTAFNVTFFKSTSVVLI